MIEKKLIKMSVNTNGVHKTMQEWREHNQARRYGCAGCDRAKDFTSLIVINRLKGRIPSYCCEFERARI